jgi:hypothetical protein
MHGKKLAAHPAQIWQKRWFLCVIYHLEDSMARMCIKPPRQVPPNQRSIIIMLIIVGIAEGIARMLDVTIEHCSNTFGR